MGKTDYENRLFSYLFNKTRRNLLGLLFGRPDESFYVSQIVQRLGSGSGAVQRELKMMTKAGIALREKKGNLVYYRANSNSPIFNELKSLAQKMDSERTESTTNSTLSALPVKAPPDKLAEFCRKHHIIKLSFFGSVLRDDFRPDSDVDVLVEFEPGHVPGLYGFADMEAELSALYGGRKVDLRTPAELSRYFRDRVVKEAKVQYAATR